MKLTIVEVNEGHCQVTYKTKNTDDQTIYYCLQEEFKDQIRMIRCTHRNK